MEYIRFRDSGAAPMESFAHPRDELAALLPVNPAAPLAVEDVRAHDADNLISDDVPLPTVEESTDPDGEVVQDLSLECDGSTGNHPLWRKSVVSSARQDLTVCCDVCDVTVGNGIFFRCAACNFDVCRICLGVHSDGRRHGFIHMLTGRTRVRRVSKVTRHHIKDF